MRHNRAFISLALGTAAAVAAGTVTAEAEPALVTGVELGVPTDQTIGAAAEVNFAASRTVGIPALKQLRGQMWDLNVPFDGQPLRVVAASHGLASRDAYVNAVRSDAALTAIAVQRAFEETVPPLDHDRPGPMSSTWSATYGDEGSMSAENLAWGYQQHDLKYMITEMWGQGELDELRNNRGYRYPETSGHLHTLIDPQNRYFGFGYVHVPNALGTWEYSGAARASSSPYAADQIPDVDRKLNLYRATNYGEQPWDANKRVNMEVLEGQKVTLQHSANMWGGSGATGWLAPEVTQNMLYPVQVEGQLTNGVSSTETQWVLVKNRQSDQFDPVAQASRSVREGKQLQFSEQGLLQGLPSGTRVSVDGGGLNWTAPEVNADTVRSLPLVFTYPDGSTDRSNVQVTVQNSQRDKFQPVVQTGASVVERQTVTLTVTGVPNDARVEGNRYTAPSVTADSTESVTVTVTYADESVDTVTVPVLVKDSLADQNPVIAPAETPVDENQTVTINLPKPPAGTTLALTEVVPGATLTGNTLTYNPGEMRGDRTFTIPVTYTYSDGSTNVVKVPIKATDTTPPGSSGGSSEGGIGAGGIIGIILAIFGLVGAIHHFMQHR
ncbi:Rib/alpha-like domain-containing protein [Staphylococcus chromogenes]|nr:Rib/alpha-like domain-containing protein [Staphylococcus chromogenes]